MQGSHWVEIFTNNAPSKTPLIAGKLLLKSRTISSQAAETLKVQRLSQRDTRVGSIRKVYILHSNIYICVFSLYLHSRIYRLSTMSRLHICTHTQHTHCNICSEHDTSNEHATHRHVVLHTARAFLFIFRTSYDFTRTLDNIREHRVIVSQSKSSISRTGGRVKPGKQVYGTVGAALWGVRWHRQHPRWRLMEADRQHQHQRWTPAPVADT